MINYINKYTDEHKIKLYEHQKQAVLHLLNNTHAGLYHSAGIGKTLSTITALNIANISAQSQDKQLRVMIVCPNHLVSTWQSEITKWGGDESWEIVQYSKFTKKNIADLCNKDIIVYDEVHYLKNLKMKYNRSARIYETRGSMRAKVAHIVSKTAKRVWSLSATIYPNVPPEIEGYFAATNQQQYVIPRKKLMDDLKVDTTEHYIKGGRGETAVSYDVKNSRITVDEMIYYMQARNIHYVDKSEIDLPEKIYKLYNDELKLTKKLKAIQDTIAESLHSNVQIEEIAEFAEFNHQSAVIKSKSAFTKSYIQSIAESARQEVIFYRHIDALDNLQSIARNYDIEYSTIRGGQSVDEKAAEIAAFQRGDARIIFVNIAQSEGMNLQCASHATFFEMPFSMKDNLQAQDRVHRIESKDTVIISYVVATEIDRHIYKLLLNKSKYYNKSQ